MANVVKVIDISCKSEFFNGPSFSIDPLTKFSDNLKGNVMDRVQMTYDVQVYTETATNFSYEILVGMPTILVFREVGSWLTDGFQIGNEFLLTVNVGFLVPSPEVVASGTIIDVNDNYLEFASTTTKISVATGKGYGWNDNLATVYEPNLIELTDQFNNVSLVDNSEQGFYAVDLTAPSVLTPQGQNKSWITGSADMAKLADTLPTLDPALASEPAFIPTYRINQDFILIPYYLEGELNNLQNVNPPELYQGNNSLKHVFSLETRDSFSNPNFSFSGTFEDNLGSVGWYNENFNGFENKFSFETLTRTDLTTALPVDEINASSITRYSFDVVATSPTFTIGGPCVLYHSKLPTAIEYQEKAETFSQIWIYNSTRQLIDDPATANGIVSNFTVTRVNTTRLTVTFDLTYNASQQNRITEGDNYVVAVSVGADEPDSNNSDRVTLLIDVNQYAKDPNILGLLNTTKLEMYPHPLDKTMISTGFTDYKGWIEDGILVDYAFTLDRDERAVLESMFCDIIAFNSSTNDSFTLQSNQIDITNQVIDVDGNQQITLDDRRGFNLETDDQFNTNILTTGTFSSPNMPYEGQIGIKMNWQSWLALPGANTVFYDAGEPNNGLNQDASRYSLVNGYAIKIQMRYNVSQDGIVTEYLTRSPDFDIRFYELPATDWSCVIETFDTDLNSTDGTILDNEPTFVRITWTSVTLTPDANDYFGIHRLEEANQPGFAIDELSSIRDTFTANRLIPLAGETNLKITNSGMTLITECLVDHTKLTKGISYKVSGRIGLKDLSGVVDLNAYSDGYSTGYN
jgi:hypothetical protein